MISVFNTDYTSTKEQRKKGEWRALAVAEYRKFLKQSIKGGMTKKTEIMDLFVQQWNSEQDFQISKKSLYDWMKKSKTGQVEKLIDKRGGYNRGQSSIPEYYRKKFDSLYLQQTKPSIESCFKEVRLESSLKGDYIPGIKAFRNYVKNMNDSIVIRSREGQKVDCQHFFRQIFLGYFSDIVQAFDTLRKNVCGDDYTSLHNPIVLSSVLPAYGMFHSIQILFL